VRRSTEGVENEGGGRRVPLPIRLWERRELSQRGPRRAPAENGFHRSGAQTVPVCRLAPYVCYVTVQKFVAHDGEMFFLIQDGGRPPCWIFTANGL